MKLANVLSERSSLQLRLTDLQERLNNNAKVQAGQKPAEDPNALLAEMYEVLTSLEEHIVKINLVNSQTKLNGLTITELLAKRDCLRMRLRIMRSFLENASRKIDRYSKSEIVIESTVSVSDLQKDVDRYSKELRILDEQIQELNWTTDI